MFEKLYNKQYCMNRHHNVFKIGSVIEPVKAPGFNYRYIFNYI